jgi:predicted nucleotidyltransferase
MSTKIKYTIPNLSKGKLLYLEPYLPRLIDLCEKYSVEKLYAFGSLVYGDFDEEKSDLDFLVKFKENDKVGMELIDMLIDLEKLFNKKVDLLRERPFQNEYFARSIENSKALLYAA